MIHPATELRFIGPGIGYGVFATAPIPRGTIVWILCHLDMVFAPGEAAKLPPAYKKIIDHYAYIDGAGNHVLCWDNGRYVNHSCDPAMLGVGTDFEVATRDIAPGEEITCEYGGLNLETPMPCACGAPSCRGTIGGEDVLKLWPDLDRRTAEALACGRGIEQPLLDYARDARLFWDYVDGRVPVPSHRAYFSAPASRPAKRARRR